MVYDPLIELLENERVRIEKEISSIDSWLTSHEVHNYRVRRKNNRYYYTVEGDGKEHYVSSANEGFLYTELNTSYLYRIKPMLEDDLRHIDSMLQHYHPEKRYLLYSKLSGGRKRFVKPLYKSVDEKLNEFTSALVEPMHYAGSVAPYRTLNGEMVRSKSEMYIADLLAHNQIPYHYEKKLTVGNNTYYPDFTVMNPRTGQKYIWEHFGRMGDPKYSGDAIAKINQYLLNGYVPGRNFILTFESESIPLNSEVVQTIVSRYLC